MVLQMTRPPASYILCSQQNIYYNMHTVLALALNALGSAHQNARLATSDCTSADNDLSDFCALPFTGVQGNGYYSKHLISSISGAQPLS
jgi:hypothetical protein